jgi:hypothetical protein
MFTCKDCVHYEACKDMYDGFSGDFDDCDFTLDCIDMGLFKNKADFVEIKKVAEILDEAFGNDYPCNFKDMDEWLPYLCEYGNTCDCSSVKCWEQLIKHYDERGADNG